MSLTSATQKSTWLIIFLDNVIDIAEKVELLLTYYDRQTPIPSTKDPNFHKKPKHIDIKVHSAKDMVA